jgi:hypothetical protein
MVSCCVPDPRQICGTMAASHPPINCASAASAQRGGKAVGSEVYRPGVSALVPPTDHPHTQAPEQTEAPRTEPLSTSARQGELSALAQAAHKPAGLKPPYLVSPVPGKCRKLCPARRRVPGTILGFALRIQCFEQNVRGRSAVPPSKRRVAAITAAQNDSRQHSAGAQSSVSESNAAESKRTEPRRNAPFVCTQCCAVCPEAW